MHKDPPGSFQAGLYVYMNTIIKEYLDWKGTYAPRASINYRIWLYRLTEICGEKPLVEYGISDYVKYKVWLQNKFSTSSVQLATVAVKNFLQYCKTQNYQCISPTLIKLPRVNAKSHRAITEREYQLVISVIPLNEFIPLRDSLLIRMLWDTGVRVSELCDLDVSQIDENKRSAIIRTKKTGNNRNIVWSEETHKVLMKYLPLRRELEKCNNASSLFVGFLKGKGWTLRIATRSVQRIVRYYVDRAGINEKITPHSFRHGWAHKRRDQNAPLAFIQKGLGHINPISTFVYEQYNDTDFLQNANKFL